MKCAFSFAYKGHGRDCEPWSTYIRDISYLSGSASAIRQPGGTPTPAEARLLGKEATDSMCQGTQRRGKWEKRGRLLNHFSKAATAQSFQSPTNLHCDKSKHLSVSAQGCSSRPSSYTRCTEKSANFPISFDVCWRVISFSWFLWNACVSTFFKFSETH